MSRDELIAYLTPFADIGSGAPKVSEKGGAVSIQMTRNGRQSKIGVNVETGRVEVAVTGFPVRGFASIAAMLGSELFADLRRWAAVQADYLRAEAVSDAKLVPINGKTSRGGHVSSIADVDALLSRRESVGTAATQVLVIDGPAGIGKTNLIERLAYDRASSYRDSPKPLILHVKSRGRVLSNLQDLMAFSLQTIRSSITYDQAPVLAKLGLIVIAIDGFDELGDPNGYELAWAQVNDLVSFVRGRGTLILAGRDTFIGRDRLFRDVKALRPEVDIVSGVTLTSPSAAQAREWLRSHNWTDVHFQLPTVAALLDDGSFALRPVFLRLLADNVRPRNLREEPETYLTPLLVRHILQREAKLFGAAVQSKLTLPGIENFLLAFLIEVARDMADSQTEALDAASLGWIAEATLGDDCPAEIVSLVKNRAFVVAFFRPDERQGFISFVHSHIHNYFLSLATIQCMAGGEIPKFVRRNLFGADFLSVFVDVASRVAQTPEVARFIERTISLSASYSHVDRTIRNVGALLLAASPVLVSGSSIEGYDVDDAVVRGTVGGIRIEKGSVHQLDCRGADLRAAEFREFQVNSLIASEGTLFSPSFPIPKILLLEDGAVRTESVEIEEWLGRRGRNEGAEISTGTASVRLSGHPIYQLLGRACRVRHYWLRDEDDAQAERILRDRHWPALMVFLQECGLLRSEKRQASGRSSDFFHIRLREQILAEDTRDASIAELFQRLERFAQDEG